MANHGAHGDGGQMGIINHFHLLISSQLGNPLSYLIGDIYEDHYRGWLTRRCYLVRGQP